MWLWSGDPEDYPVLTAEDRRRLAFGEGDKGNRTRAVTAPAGNSKLAKGSQGGRRLRAKDDALAAAILAVAAGTRPGRRPKRPRWRYAGMA